MSKLNLPEAVLVVSGHEGDEQKGYFKMLKKKAKEAKIRVKYIGDRINSTRKIKNGKRIYTLWDCYLNSDFITYPTEMEGFGNQFIESMYFKKPIIVTPYEVYEKDIAPLGFDVVEMPHKVTGEVLEKVKNVAGNEERRKEMTRKNFELGKKHFSYQAVEKKLIKLFGEMGLEKYGNEEAENGNGDKVDTSKIFRKRVISAA